MPRSKSRAESVARVKELVEVLDNNIHDYSIRSEVEKTVEMIRIVLDDDLSRPFDSTRDEIEQKIAAVIMFDCVTDPLTVKQTRELIQKVTNALIGDKNGNYKS